MPSIEVERYFEAPVEDVWKVYTDHAGWSEWAGISRSSLEVEGSPDRNGTGAVRVLASGGFAAREEIFDFDPPERMTYRLSSGPLPMKNHRGEVHFQRENGGTRVVWRCRFDSRVPGLGGVLGFIVTRVFRTALDGLAEHSFPKSGG